MSIRTRTTYLAKCDYPGCHIAYDFWGTSTEDVITDVIYDEEWLCLVVAGGCEPRFFCPLHLRYTRNQQYGWLPVFYDPDSQDTQPALNALRKYYADVRTPQPLPKLECEDTILAIMTSEGTK